MKRELEELLYEAKSSQEKLIVEVLIANFENIPDLKLDEIASLSFCSKTSVRRIIIKLGYKGYLEYQLHVKMFIQNKNDNLECSFGYIGSCKASKIIEFLNSCNHISIFGSGADSIAAQYLFRQLLEFGYTVTWINESDLLHSITNDNVIIISNTGRSQSVNQLAKELKNNQNCQVASITKIDSELASIVDLPIVHDLKNSAHKNDQMDTFIIINQISKLL